MSGVMRALPLQSFFAFLLDGHVVSDCASGNRSHNCMMMRKVTGNATNNGTFETTRLGDRDICGAKGQNHRDQAGMLVHLGLLDVITASASLYNDR
jgi:hypothetical protein